jgi:exopolysaccharide biosynthesis polyprenyl glycosylphosphotransferase
MVKFSLKPRPLYIFIDFLLIVSSFTIAYFIKYTYKFGADVTFDFSHIREFIFIFLLWTFFIVTAFYVNNLYSTDRRLSILGEFFRVFAAIIYSNVIIGSVIFFTKYDFFSRQVFLVSACLLVVFLAFFRVVKRLIIRRLINKGFHNINVLIIGAGRLSKPIVEEIKKYPWWGFRVVGFLDDHIKHDVTEIPVIGKIKDFPVVARKYFIDEVIIIATYDQDMLMQLVNEAKKLSLGVRLFPGYSEEELPKISITQLGMIPLVSYGEKKYYISGFIIKRILDVISVLFLFILLLPFILIIALLIKFDSSGPVLYTQYRMGMKGRIFKFYKFRSMAKDADVCKDGLLGQNEVKDGIIFKMKGDPRITRIGRFLRRYSLDELPQLLNVIRGDMSLVGPRPFPVDESSNFEHKHMPRLNIRPGITGLPQVRGRSELSFNQWVKWDLWYIRNWSFALDMRIILMTIPAVIKGKGAY